MIGCLSEIEHVGSLQPSVSGGSSQSSLASHLHPGERNWKMPRAKGFDKLFDQLEAALITSRAMKLKSISDLLLLAFGEATQRMSAELVKVDKKKSKKK
jgi:hypothetical protein